jgi:voltage-gated potassium channel
VCPITDKGKILSGIIAILGLGMIALPSGIIPGGFREIIENILKLHKRSILNGSKRYFI